MYKSPSPINQLQDNFSCVKKTSLSMALCLVLHSGWTMTVLRSQIQDQYRTNTEPINTKAAANTLSSNLLYFMNLVQLLEQNGASISNLVTAMQVIETLGGKRATPKTLPAFKNGSSKHRRHRKEPTKNVSFRFID